MKKLSKIVLIIIMSLMSVTMLYLAVGSPDIDIEAIMLSYDNLSTKSAFYQYTKEDWVEYIEQVREETEDVENKVEIPNTIVNKSDLRDIAKVVGTSIVNSYKGSGTDYYSTSDGTPYSVSYGAVSTTLKYRCCTTMAYGVKVLSGDKHYADVIVGTEWLSAGIIDKFQDKSPTSMIQITDGMTCSELQVGDILIREKHTEIVVYKDDLYVYVANGGGSNSIARTATEGYSRMQELGSTIRSYGSTPFLYILRW